MQRVVACIGDSITAGTGAGYPGMLQQMLSQRQPNTTWDVKNFGRDGSGAKEWAIWLGATQEASVFCQKFSGPDIRSTLAEGCDVVIIMLGTNDAQLGYWNEQNFTNYVTQVARKMMSDFPSASIVLAVPPPIAPNGSFAKSFDANVVNSTLPRLIPQIAASLGVPSADCFTAFGGAAMPPSTLSQDGVHMGETGFSKIASVIVDAVLRSTSNSTGSTMPANSFVDSSQALPQQTQTPLPLSTGQVCQVGVGSPEYSTASPLQFANAPLGQVGFGSLEYSTANPLQFTNAPLAPSWPQNVTGMNTSSIYTNTSSGTFSAGLNYGNNMALPTYGVPAMTANQSYTSVGLPISNPQPFPIGLSSATTQAYSNSSACTNFQIAPTMTAQFGGASFGGGVIPQTSAPLPLGGVRMY